MSNRNLGYVLPFVVGIALASGLWIGNALNPAAPEQVSMGQSRY